MCGGGGMCVVVVRVQMCNSVSCDDGVIWADSLCNCFLSLSQTLVPEVFPHPTTPRPRESSSSSSCTRPTGTLAWWWAGDQRSRRTRRSSLWRWEVCESYMV